MSIVPQDTVSAPAATAGSDSSRAPLLEVRNLVKYFAVNEVQGLRMTHGTVKAVDVIHGLHGAVGHPQTLDLVDREVLDQVAYLEQRSTGRVGPRGGRRGRDGVLGHDAHDEISWWSISAASGFKVSSGVARWHRIRRPGPTERSSGSWDMQASPTRSWKSHLGWNEHPGGRWTRLGGAPLIAFSESASSDADGRLCRSPQV